MSIILHFLRKEFLQLRRDPKIVKMIFISPVLQLLIFGFALNLDVKDLPIVVCDLDNTETSRALIDRFTHSGYFTLIAHAPTMHDIDPYLDDGKASIALTIPAGFADRIAAGRTTQLQAIVDGSESNAASTGLGYASLVVGNYAKGVLIEALAKKAANAPGAVSGGAVSSGAVSGGAISSSGVSGGGVSGTDAMSGGAVTSATLTSAATPTTAALRPLAIDAETRVWYNPELRSRYFLIPGILGMLLMTMTMMLSSLAIVKEREIGTMDQLAVTPIRPYQLMLGKLAPFIIIGLIDVTLIVLGITLMFGIPVRGSVPLLYALSVIFLMTTLGLGLFVSTISHTQQQAMMTAMFFVLMPMNFLSGFIFPIENMPQPVQWITAAIPLRYFFSILRGIYLRGAGFDALWKDFAALTTLGLAILTLSIYRFKKTIA